MKYFTIHNRFFFGILIVFLSLVFSSCAQSTDVDQKRDTTTSNQSFRSTEPVKVQQPTITHYVDEEDASLNFRIEVISDSLKLRLNGKTSIIEISELSDYIKENDIVDTHKKTCLVGTKAATPEQIKAVIKVLNDNSIKSFEYRTR